jgi:hypothetical protein
MNSTGFIYGEVFVLIALVTLLTFNCSTNKQPENTDLVSITGRELLPRQVGDFIKISPLGAEYAALCNNWGMSGAEGRNQWHSNTAVGMYVAAAKQDFVFDIGHIEQLGELHIWNYNESGKTENGIKNITISISEDNVEYKKFGSFDLKKAEGLPKMPVTNLVDGSFVDFSGKTARFIKLSPVDNYGGLHYGLSEIRLFRYKQDVYKGAYISASPLERYSSSGDWLPTPESYNLTNGAGLSDPFGANARHDNNPKHMYYTRSSVIGFPIDLKGKYPVEKIVIWNYNEKGNTDYGLKKIRISVSEDGISWKSLSKMYDLPQASGEYGLEPSIVITEPLYTRYIRIDNKGHYGGKYAGLSAVRCYTGEGWFADNAPDWTALFSSYEGWSGADGIYMANLDGKDYDTERKREDQKTFIVFSDTICSTIDPATDLRSGVYMPNNTSALLSGGKPDSTKIDFYFPREGGPSALIIPDPLEKASYGDGYKYYWMGDPFVLGNKLYIYAHKIDHIKEGFGFEQLGVDLVSYDIINGHVDYSTLKRYNDMQNRLSKISGLDKWYLGGAVFENTKEAGVLNPDGYIYVYGYYDKSLSGRKLVSARVKDTDVTDFSRYEYLQANGKWETSMSSPKFLASDIAPEISITEIKTGTDKGKFLLVNTHYTIGSDIKLSISASLTGEFTNKQTIFFHDTTNSIAGKGNNSYNAKAHPAISNDRELFVSYNVNGNDCFVYGDIYRPRFIRYAQVPVLIKGR